MSDEFTISVVRWRFVEFDVELGVLEEYLNLVESELPDIVAKRRRHVQESFEGLDEVEILQKDWGLEELISDGVVTRYITAAAVVASWAVYESAVKMVADYLAEVRHLSRHMDDIRKGFQKRAKQYFAQTLKIRLHSGADEQRLGELYFVRNALAHANGQLDSVDEREGLEAFVKTRGDLDVVGGTVIVSLEFARYALELVTRVLNDLVDRVEKGR